MFYIKLYLCGVILNCFEQEEIRDWHGDGEALQEDIGPDMSGFFFNGNLIFAEGIAKGGRDGSRADEIEERGETIHEH